MKIVLFAILFCTYPVSSYSWFSIQRDQGVISFCERVPDFGKGSKEYILPCNTGGKQENICLDRESENRSLASADRIPVDIPFNILSKEEIKPEASLDRQMAANLRLRNIMEEYISLKVRTKQALKGFKIPSFEAKGLPGEVSAVAGYARVQVKLRKDMENMIYSRGNYSWQIQGRYDPSLAFGKAEFGSRGLGQTGKRYSTKSYADSGTGSSENMGEGTAGVRSGAVQFLLDTLGYLLKHKMAVLFWFVTALLSSTIVVLVLKK